MCPCREADTLRRLKGIMHRAIKWYQENEHDDSFTYDESWGQFLDLDRGSLQEILRLLSKR